MAEKPGWGLAGWPFLAGCPTLDRIWMRQMQLHEGDGKRSVDAARGLHREAQARCATCREREVGDVVSGRGGHFELSKFSLRDTEDEGYTRMTRVCCARRWSFDDDKR